MAFFGKKKKNLIVALKNYVSDNYVHSKYFVIKLRSSLFYGSDFCRGQGVPQMEIWLVLNWEPGAAAELACSANHYQINNGLRNVSCVQANILQYSQAAKEKAEELLRPCMAAAAQRWYC